MIKGNGGGEEEELKVYESWKGRQRFKVVLAETARRSCVMFSSVIAAGMSFRNTIKWVFC
jgi:hypothetical protein